jgi:hypothetical protein
VDLRSGRKRPCLAENTQRINWHTLHTTITDFLRNVRLSAALLFVGGMLGPSVGA